MNTERQNLSGLALRGYAQKSFWHNEMVKRLMTNGDYSQLLKYNLGNSESVKEDVPMLRNLISDFAGHYCDLFTVPELLKQIDYLPESEYQYKQSRIDEYFKDNSVYQELKDLLEKVQRGELPEPEPGSFVPVEIMELLDLAKLKSGYPTSEPVDYAPFEDDTAMVMLDLVTSEDEPGTMLDLSTDNGQEVDFEPAIEPALPIVTQSTHNSKPIIPTSEHKTGLQLRRAYSGLYTV